MKQLLLIALTSCLLLSCKQNGDNTSETTEKEQSTTPASGKPQLPMVDITKVASMTKEELRIARNTVYAKYGRVFTSADLKEHFSQQTWYKENPRFKESDLKAEDKRIVQMIRFWEDKTELLWRGKIDMSGNGSFEYCYVLYNGNKNTFALIINEYSREFDHYWGQEDSDDLPPKEWAKINVEAIDIVPDDFRQEILISQRYNDWEDPGTENFIVTFDTEMHVAELSSTDYDGGTLTFKEGVVTMQVSHCPEHTRDYRLERGKLVQFDEYIGPEPPGGCAACFSGTTNIATSISSSKPIKELKKGDTVLSWNTETGALEMTTVNRVLEVYHEQLYRITFGDQTLELTEDHPLWIPGKGWASIAPEKTTRRYANYSAVANLQTGDMLQLANGEVVQITSVALLHKGQTTYAVESLENGQAIIVNGCVAGAEVRFDQKSL